MASQQTLQRYWKRCGYIEIENNSNQMEVFSQSEKSRSGGSNANPSTSLDFRFDGVKWGDVYGRFKVGILGLSTNRIMELTTWNVAKSVLRRRRIRVYAGYEPDFAKGRSVSPIFDGYILTAMPTNPPEMWMNFDCIRYYETNQPVVKTRVVNGELKDILKLIADINNLEWDDKRWHAISVSPNKESKFEISGVKTMLIHVFASKFGVKIVTNNTSTKGKNGVLDVYDAKPWLGAAPSSPDVVSAETGMLAIGNIDMAGANVTIRLSDRHELNSWIALQSRLIPSANEKYVVLSKHLKGHLRGQEWQTELKCVRQGALI